MIFVKTPISFVRSAALAVSIAIAAPGAHAQRIPTELPDDLKGVKLIEHRGETVPGDIKIVDSKGRDRTTADYFDGDRPVLLIMAYYDCPLLCTLVLNAAQDAMNKMSWTAGKEFRVLTVSFDYENTTEDAYARQQEYLLGYKEVVPDESWEFCTTDAENAKRLATSVGFHYKFIPETGEYSHPATLIFLTPDGKINSYLENIVYDPRDVKLALLEASEGKQGSIFDRIEHFCFTFNGQEGKYTLHAMNVMKLGGLVTMLFLGSFVAVYAIGSKRARKHADDHATPPSTHTTASGSA